MNADPPPLPDADDQAPPLSWRVWLLLPLVLASLVSVVVALTDPLARPDRDPFDIPRKQQEKRVPYDDELQQLMIDQDRLTLSQLKRYAAVHDRCKTFKNGLIPESLREEVDEILDRHR